MSKKLLVSSLFVICVATAGALTHDAYFTTNETISAAVETTGDAPVEPAAVLISTANESGENGASKPHVENSRSIYDLRWTFGGKPQRGWHLYAPLIGQLVGSPDPPTSLAFAATLARWQGDEGLVPTGIVDADTLMQMVKIWQEQRSPDRAYPTPNELVTVPAAEFFDTARAHELRRVRHETYAAYKRLLRAAIADKTLGLAVSADGELAPWEKRLRIISAFRSREYQEQLRRQSPHSGRAGLAVNSPHFTGRALDIYIAGEPVETKDYNRALQVNTPLYRWLVKNAGTYGFRPYFYEPWHWEFSPEPITPREPKTEPLSPTQTVAPLTRERRVTKPETTGSPQSF